MDFCELRLQMETEMLRRIITKAVMGLEEQCQKKVSDCPWSKTGWESNYSIKRIISFNIRKWKRAEEHRNTTPVLSGFSRPTLLQPRDWSQM